MSPFGLFGAKVGHQPLFHDLCAFHALDKKVRLLLERVIQTQSLEMQGRIFLDPSILLQAVGDPQFEADRNQLRELLSRWFGITA